MCGRLLISTAAAMVLAALAASAEAADERAVTIGDRVRVTAPSVSPEYIEGTLAAVDRETMTVVSGDDGTSVGVPRSRIAKLEVTRGKKSRWGIGALIGAGAGVLLGVVASNPPRLPTISRSTAGLWRCAELSVPQAGRSLAPYCGLIDGRPYPQTR